MTPTIKVFLLGLSTLLLSNSALAQEGIPATSEVASETLNEAEASPEADRRWFSRRIAGSQILRRTINGG